MVVWNKIIEQAPPFALLYKDEKDWYDALPFESTELMEEFIAQHTKNSEIFLVLYCVSLTKVFT